jgi:archaeal flagellar protein FlaJ
MEIYTTLVRLFPRKIIKTYHQMMLCSTIKTEPNKLLGFFLLFSIAVSLYIASFVGMFVPWMPYPISVVLAFAVLLAVFYFRIVFSVDGKAKFAELVLPDALQLMSSNIRAGLTTDKALLLAARPEFGPLAEEIRRVGKETMTGTNLSEALVKMNNRIKSENLVKTVDLIVNSIKSGGKLADLLDQTAGDLRDQQMIQKEISASVLLYAIFIFIAIAFAAPLLFAMSSFLVKILSMMSAKIGSSMPSDMAGAPISVSNVSISADFLLTYSIISLLVSGFFGSLTMGLILKGNAREGLKFAPMLIIISLALFFAGSYIMETFFSSMMRI